MLVEWKEMIKHLADELLIQELPSSIHDIMIGQIDSYAVSNR